MQNRLGYRVKNKIRNKAGESLTETLVSVLISALAILMLAGSITAASRMITRTRNSLERYYGANECLVRMTESGTYDVDTDKCNITISKGSDAESIAVDYAVNSTFDDKVVAYRKSE